MVERGDARDKRFRIFRVNEFTMGQKSTVDAHTLVLAIDNYLISSGKDATNAIDANEYLAEIGLLSQSADRPGRELRRYLQRGEFPHAYQIEGKHDYWIIPHS
jgi:hypothetical protein